MLDKQHVVIDIETTSTKTNAGVFQIACLFFIPNDFIQLKGKPIQDVFDQIKKSNDVSSRYVWYIDPLTFLGDSRIDVSANTMNFIQNNNRNVFIEACQSGNTIQNVSPLINDVFEQIAPDHIWAKDPSFDCVILRNLADAYGARLDLPFYLERSCRTALAVNDWLELDRFFTGNLKLKHEALADCVTQLNDILTFLFVLDKIRQLNSQTKETLIGEINAGNTV